MEDLLSTSDSIWWIVYRIWLVGPRNHSIHLLRSQKTAPKDYIAIESKTEDAESCSSKHGLRGTPPNQPIWFVTFPSLRPSTDEVQLLCGMAWLFHGSPTCNGWTSECLDERIPGWSWIVFLSHALEHHYIPFLHKNDWCYGCMLWVSVMGYVDGSGEEFTCWSRHHSDKVVLWLG